MRGLAGWDPGRYAAVARWPLREALWAWHERIKREAFEQWRFEMLRWSLLAPHSKKPGDPPKEPRILQE